MAKRRGRRRRRQRRINSHRKINRIIDGADFISSMPDEVLQHILSFIPTDLAIRTCVLSRRWRHAWSELPCLDFEKTGPGIDRTLSSYRALKITSFRLRMTHDADAPDIDSWVEFAVSRNVEKLTLIRGTRYGRATYRFPDLFYLSSSLTKLRVDDFYMIPRCTVSWSSLRILTLTCCNLYDDCISNILSGCPKLASLKLHHFAGLLKRLDLSKSPSLRTLEIYRTYLSSGPMEIVAPHIHYLKLIGSEEPCTLIDVSSSLAEAYLGICIKNYHISKAGFVQEAGFLQTMVLKMLAQLQNAERLTFGSGGTLLQILSLAELRGVPFPTLKVQTLTLRTMFEKCVIPGIARLLQNSPGLKKLTVDTRYSRDTIMDKYLDRYLGSQGLNSVTCWASKCEVFPTWKEIYSMLGCNDATSKLLASFMELVLRNAMTLKKMVIWLGDKYFNDEQWFEELLQMVGTLSHNYHVSIELKR
ncbi:hypothetical protein EUTSA_v10013441mg [Eutrema salsugineum]|uniref:F-box domain-containing protein n=1 Tax=Eutrema salsugineum TaxID=72664 RepID=V4L966_EUTSA|nr:putative F-box/LRR-repeat protein At5g02700 [Eutrema salsugineum]ESQ40184.1 hypothetical protein EUTSA_v10013441mg [Eutrema salsugineum]